MPPKNQKTVAQERRNTRNRPVRDAPGKKAIRTMTSNRTAEFAGWAGRRMGVFQTEALEIALRLLREKLVEHCDETVPKMDTGEYDFDRLPE